MNPENTLPVRREEQIVPPWPRPNKRRGQHWHTAAVLFIKEFPIGTRLTVEAFDAWAEAHGIAEKPTPLGVPRKSDAWQAHVLRRNRLTKGIKTASTHPRMEEEGIEPYTIVSMPKGGMLVRSTNEAIWDNMLTKKVASILITERRKFEYILQSHNPTGMSRFTLAGAAMVYRAIMDFADATTDQGRRVQRTIMQFQIDQQLLGNDAVQLALPSGVDDIVGTGMPPDDEDEYEMDC